MGLSSTRVRVFAAVVWKPMTAVNVARHLNMKRGKVYYQLNRLVDMHLIARTGQTYHSRDIVYNTGLSAAAIHKRLYIQ